MRLDLLRKRWSLKKKTFWIGMVAPGNLPLGRIQNFWNGQIIMGDLPRWKMQRLFQSGLIVKGDIPRQKKINGFYSSDVIVMGDLIRRRIWLSWQKDLARDVLKG
jgi:hypothetical protein